MSDATTWTSLLLQKQGMQARAEMEEEAQKQAQIRQLLSAGMNAAGSISGAMKQAKLDGIANALMNEEAAIPRAQAVDPSLQAGADAKAEKMPGYHTGGLDEMKLAMAMEDQKFQRMAMQLREQEAAQLGVLRQQQLEARQRGQAAEAFQNSTPDMREAYQDALAYNKSVSVGMNELSKATTPDDYNNAAAGVMSLYAAAKKRGLEVPQPKISPFVSPEERAAQAAVAAELPAAEARLEKMKSDWWPDLFGADERQRQLVEDMRKKAAPSPAPAPALAPVPSRDRSISQLTQQVDADLVMPANDSAPPPPAEAVNMLLANPDLAPQFNAKYGAGAAESYLE